ncbi:uncharacterized protein LAJ45_09172 [Morchella importuna]|uniref:uncharacterized protein n=1 Tax=Morchella importuna TaxID=1174673 RepID=UPI001E8E818C|nr:uncharacterized protein LAJ45_09172 [Morchella importuna]KAH8146798.1 hypothetical protein LAJ45_09172 [Morchella importuna]
MSSSRPQRPKRPGATLDAAVRSGAGLPDSKRPKFDVRNPFELAPDAPDDDDVFLEVDEGAVGKRRVRRNRVDIEGYESDSSGDGFDETHKAWKADEEEGAAAAGKGGEEEEDEDMFADLRDSGDEGAKPQVKGAEKGQDFASRREFADIIDEDKGKGDDSGDEDEEPEEVDSEVGEGGKKKKAPKIDAFNMTSEMDEGRFDDAGNFIRKAAEKDAIHDSWLQGVSRKDMKRAKEAREKRDKELREKMKEDDAISTSGVLAELIGYLEKGETVLEALARLGNAGKKKKAAHKISWRDKKKKAAGGDEMEVDKGKEPEDPVEARRKEAVERITGAADRLLTRGQNEIYDETRESLIRQYRRESGEDWVEPKAPAAQDNGAPVSKTWEFRWTDGRDDGGVHGPYGTAEMASWNQHGFFDEGAEFRWVDGTEGWTRVTDFE